MKWGWSGGGVEREDWREVESGCMIDEYCNNTTREDDDYDSRSMDLEV